MSSREKISQRESNGQPLYLKMGTSPLLCGSQVISDLKGVEWTFPTLRHNSSEGSDVGTLSLKGCSMFILIVDYVL
jgi:hypothetical protein